MKKLGIVCFLCFISINLFSQLNSVDHWETVFNADTVFKYMTSNDAMADSEWRDNGYNDSAWHQGTGGVGYGDADDNTIIDGIGSVFLRRQINIIDKNEIASAILNIDYDDAFVAYLNGVEIARSVGLTSAYPTYYEYSSAQHDAVIPIGGTPGNIIIDTDILQNNLVTGTNIVAIQVHNATATSTDLSSNTWFTVGLNVATQRYLPTPSWFVRPMTSFSSNLPILVIETEGGMAIQDEPRINAYLGIVYNGPGARNNSDDAFLEYNGNIGIEIRGNSTSNYPKKPYNFETRDDLGENLNVSLLGLPVENDWTLRASYFDHTFIRNSLANHMSRKTGCWASRTRHVEVLLNGEYQGIYVLMEKLKRDDNRLDIAKLDTSEITGEDLTGGYIWEITGFIDNELEVGFGESRKLKYPKFDDVTQEQLDYIQSFDDAFRNKMRQNAKIYGDPNSGYVQHIWTESFIFEVIIQEAMRNSDAYGWSGYYHKDKNGLINAGPVWDFDQSAGNSSYPDNGVTTGWLIEHPNTSNTPFYWTLLLNDPFFKYSLSLRWKELRADKFSNANLIDYIDSTAAVLAEAQSREFARWPVLGAKIWRETNGYQDRDTYQKEVNYLKNFLISRWNWMDNQLANVLEPPGYPEISVVSVNIDTADYLSSEKLYIDLDEAFSFPYTPELKYTAYSTDTNVVLIDVKKTDSVKFELNNLGSCEIILGATDTYGNKKDTTFVFSVLNGTDPIDTVQNPSFAERYDVSDQILVFPNPASDNLIIRMDNFDYSFNRIDIYNITGQMIDNIYSGSNNYSVNYDCSMLGNGVYLVRIQTDNNEVYTKKLVIRK